MLKLSVVLLLAVSCGHPDNPINVVNNVMACVNTCSASISSLQEQTVTQAAIDTGKSIEAAYNIWLEDNNRVLSDIQTRTANIVSDLRAEFPEVSNEQINTVLRNVVYELDIPPELHQFIFLPE